MFGSLVKKPFGHSSNKWSRRFFVIKDGFVLYYPDNERKEFERKKGCFNIHPRGILPLGGCSVQPYSEPGHPFAISIRSEELDGCMILGADTEYERDKWIQIITQSTRITWNNARLGDSMIEHLESQGLQMAQEKQVYFDKLQTEVMALHDEKQKTEELERINVALEEERQKIEKLSESLKDEYSKMKSELEVTLDAMKSVEDDKQKLHSTSNELQHQLEELESEKSKIILQMSRHQSETQKLSEEKKSLSDTTKALTLNLQQIESQTQALLQEKSEAEHRLQEKEAHACQLEEEKANITEHTQELQDYIKDLSAQKALTEAELKEEVIARLEAERRLQEAEESLKRLEKAVVGQRAQKEDSEKVISFMVFFTAGFFENLAFEAQLDSDKSFMIKNSLHARKTMVRRAKTMRFEANR
ncbi:hypothetical protein CAPTEDRAFT_155422, partial [Capitella teleta]